MGKAGYEYLLAYKITVPVYDYTVEFCHRWIDKKSRMTDQMTQAARSGMQNISEGHKQESLENYIKLVGVARGSLEELLKDYLSFARQNQITVLKAEEAKREIGEIGEMWKVLRTTPALPDNPNFPPLPSSPDKAVNFLITLINQANSLTDKLIESLKKKFIEQGGFRENLFKKRLAFRTKTTLLLILILAFSLPAPVYAENVSSDNYEIQMGNLNMGSGLPASSTYKVGLTGGQNAPGLYTSTGYKVMAGFWYIKTIIPFSFTISGLAIDFGTLTSGSPSTQTSTLTVSAGGAGGYQVTASESAALTSSAGAATIPDTACDGSSNTCTATSAKPWTSNSKYGFGYNVSGNDVSADFTDNTYFRPFSTSGAVIMSNNQVGKNRTATVTYKVNISPSQAAGDYQNYIMYIATPTY